MEEEFTGAPTWWSYATIPQTPYMVPAFMPPFYLWPRSWPGRRFRPWRRYPRRWW